MELKAGDHIRVWRDVGPDGYYHHGIYIGLGKVIHFAGELRRKLNAKIKEAALRTFLADGKLEKLRYEPEFTRKAIAVSVNIVVG